jgi:hypothetical protein
MTGHDCADSVDAVAVPALDPHLSQRDAEQGVEPSPDVPRPSTLRVVTLAGVMLLTYFLGVSHDVQRSRGADIALKDRIQPSCHPGDPRNGKGLRHVRIGGTMGMPACYVVTSYH